LAVGNGGPDASHDARHLDVKAPLRDARPSPRSDTGPAPRNDGGPSGPHDSGNVDGALPDSSSDATAKPDVSAGDGSIIDAARDAVTHADVAPRDGSPPIGPGSDATPHDGSPPVGPGSDARSPDASPSDASSDAPNPSDGAVSQPFPTTPLTGSSIAEGATNVPRTTWIRLDFGSGLDPRAANGVTLDCGSGTPGYDVDLFGSTTFVVNPRAPLDPSASCVVTFRGPTGSQQIHFEVAAQGAAAVVPYDRNDPASFEPFPDDFFLVDDATKRTGRRVDIRVPEVEASLMALLDSVLTPTRALDGMSPLAPIVVALPDAVDPLSVPRTATASVDAFATIGLFDVDPASTTYRKRIPFDTIIRNESNIGGAAAHTLVVFPSVPLAPRGKYAFAVTNRALVSPSRPLVASAFFEKVAAGQGATADELRLAPVLDGVLGELAGISPPLRKDDVALALGITVRSDDDIPKDLSAVRTYVQAAAPPQFAVTNVAADTTAGTDVAAIVQGTWSPPDWSTGGVFIDRDTSGVPIPAGVATLAFTLAVPKSAATAPAPIVVYQHGQPGNALAEVPNAARRGLAKAGFAVVGFTDVANRDVIPNGDIVQLNVQALATLLVDHDLPDYLSLLTHADQLAFLKMVRTLGSVDVLPVGSPDGLPDLDASAPLGYLGISQGSVHGIGLMAFAPEVHAAALVAGAGRFGATLVHQTSEALYQGIGTYFPALTRGQFYAGIAAVQMDFDRQDPQNLARFVYRAPLALGASARASILMTEGLGDTLVPFYATRSGANQLGLVQLEPHAETAPFLPTAAGPLQGNVDAVTTSAFFQFVPFGYAGVPSTPGCVASGQTEGHYCAQTAAEAILQRITFFTSHVGGVPQIIDPFP
jgi:hypothetical protein